MSIDKANSYNDVFKKLYYHLYSNSNSSRAERIISDISKLLLCKLAADRKNKKDVLENYLDGKLSISDSLVYILNTEFPTLNPTKEGFSLNDKDLKKGLRELLNVDLNNAPAHIIGDAFQALIGPNIRGDKGQFFTPRNIVRCMINVLRPKPGDTIIDPACGTGGFLIETFAYLKNEYPEQNFTGKLIGIDKDKDLAYLATALLEVTTKGKSLIINDNSFGLVANIKEVNKIISKADIVLTNPPFGSKIGITDQSILQNFNFGYNWTYSTKGNCWYKLDSIANTQDPQILFLELCIRMLKPGGKLGIILPEGVFGNKTLGYVWDYIREQGKILGMIDNPRTTFQPSTDTKTNILFFQKTSDKCNNCKCFISVALNCGHDKRGKSLNAAGEPLPNDFEHIGKSFPKDNEINYYWTSCNVKKYYLVPRYYFNQVDQSILSSEYGETISLKELCQKGYITIKKGHEVGADAYGTGLIPFIRTSDINNLEISIDPTNSVSEEIYEKYSKQQNLKAGDILLVADGRYRIGKTAILTNYNKKCIVQSHIKILSLNNDEYFDCYEFLFLLNLPLVQKQLRNLTFIQSTLGTIGKRIEEVKVPIIHKTNQWTSTINDFKNTIEARSLLLEKIKTFEHVIEL